MHADELRQAVTKIVELLKRAEIRVALDRYRAARGDEREVAAARLGHAGATIMERMQELSPAERRIVRLMHLEELGTSEYWQALLDGTSDAKAHQGDIVRLASRIMFATGQLPVLVSLLEPLSEESDGQSDGRPPLANGEGRLVVRLADAGETASDPDRVARSIDGVDMLYSACASIARRPAMNLRLDGVDGTVHRDLHFTGERDSLSAVIAVIESIPAALADVDPNGEIDLEAIIASLPVFEDLDKLGSLGTFSSRDLKDISETMHQGALLVLESGVVLVEELEPSAPSSRSHAAAVGSNADAAPTVPPTPRTDDETTPSATAPEASTAPAADTVSPDLAPSATETPVAINGDEHYERYLREREAMQNLVTDGAADRATDQRRDAVEELLRSLDQTRNGN